jgi:hypothetical protein
MAMNQQPTLDLVHAIAAKSTRAEDRAAAWDALIRARGLAFEETAWRRRSERLVVSTERRQAIDRVQQLVMQLDSLYRAGSDTTSEQRIKATTAQLALEEVDLAHLGYDLRFEQQRRHADFADIAKALGPRSAVVGFAEYMDSEADSVLRYVAYVLRSGAPAPDLVQLGRADDIDPLVLRWHREAATRPAASQASTGEALRRVRAVGDSLRARIWDPIAPLLQGATDAYVIPEGLLHFVNFDVLPAGPGRYLVEESMAIRILTSERDLVAPEARPPGGAGILILSDPAFDQRSDSSTARDTAGPQDNRAAVALRGIASDCNESSAPNFPPLPGTRSEGRDIARLWRAPRGPSGTAGSDSSVLLLEGGKATKQRF